MNNKYIVFKDGRIGVIKSICTCEKCKERGEAEIFIDKVEGGYLDCRKLSDIQDVLYVGDCISEGIKKLVQYYENEIERVNFINECRDEAIAYFASQIIKQ